MSEMSVTKLSKFMHLPSLPHLLLRLIEACNRSEASIKDISDIIAKDPALTGKILRLVNSAHFGFRRKIRQPAQAAGMLGIEAIRNVAISSSIYEAFRQAPDNPDFNLKHFWWHSLRCALLSRRLAQSVGYPNAEEAFLVGLMHDLGRLVLWMNFGREYGDLLRKSQDRPELILSEEARLGASHPDLGAGLLELWNLESLLADAVRYHHESPERIRSALPLVQVLYLANALTESTEPVQWNRLDPILSILNLTGSAIKSHMAEVDEEIVEIADSLGIVIERPDAGQTEPSASDREKRGQLDRYGKQSALLFAALRNLVGASDVSQVVHELQLALATLFDLSNLLFFIKDMEHQQLTGWSTATDGDTGADPHLTIPLVSEDCLATASFTRQAPVTSFGREPKDLSILDQQIIRYIGKEGIFCQPLVSGSESLGVIVLGLDLTEFQLLNGEQEMLSLFSAQAANKLHAITAQKSHERAIQDERLQAFTGMARKVVHEVNNPLTLIKNYLKILDLKLGEQHIYQDEIKIINEEIDRVGELLGGLTTLSERRVIKTEAVNVNRLLAQLCKIVGEPLRANADIHIDLQLARNLPPAAADLNALRQVFVNLIKNAAEAVSAGGHLRIRTRCPGSSRQSAGLDTGAAVPSRLEIIVEDDGPGIPESLKDRIFEPYVSSKGESHSGLGLSIVHNIIKDLNGVITVESEIGHGTRFVVSLPTLATHPVGKTSAR